jgi:hypothetical protein
MSAFEATEEAILNSLFMAETIKEKEGRGSGGTAGGEAEAIINPECFISMLFLTAEGAKVFTRSTQRILKILTPEKPYYPYNVAMSITNRYRTSPFSNLS